MSCECGNLRHGGVAPDDDLVLRVPVRRHQLVDVFRPAEITYLAAGVDAIQRGGSLRIPEAYAPIGGPTAGGEEPVLMRGPRDGLDGRRVLAETKQWCC